MFNKIEQLFMDLENWIVQKIDADENYDAYESLERYMMANCPNEYALYHVLYNYLEQSAKEDK